MPGKSGRPIRVRTSDKDLSPEVQQLLRDRDYHVKKIIKASDKGVLKYDKAKWAYIIEGYDLLENFLVARQVICKRYKIKIGLLEVLLHFSSSRNRYFTQKQWAVVPKQLAYSRLESMMTKEFVAIQSKGEHLGDHIYTLSAKSQTLVRTFYQYLSGEKPLPEKDIRACPQKRKDATEFDKKVFSFIEKVNTLTKDEKLKKLYT